MEHNSGFQKTLGHELLSMTLKVRSFGSLALDHDTLASISFLLFRLFSLISICFTWFLNGFGMPEVILQLVAVVRCGSLVSALVCSGSFWRAELLSMTFLACLFRK